MDQAQRKKNELLRLNVLWYWPVSFILTTALPPCHQHPTHFCLQITQITHFTCTLEESIPLSIILHSQQVSRYSNHSHCDHLIQPLAVNVLFFLHPDLTIITLCPLSSCCI